MERKYDLTKYKKLAHILEVVTRILYRIGIVLSIILAVTGITMLIAPINSNIFKIGSGGWINLSMDGLIKYNYNIAAVSNAALKNMTITIVLCGAVALWIPVPIFKQLSLILKTVKDDKPFSPENAKRLSVIGKVLIAGSIILKIVEAAMVHTVIQNLNLENINVNYSIDSTMLLMGLMVLILSSVFRHGCYLQKEYDSTV